MTVTRILVVDDEPDVEALVAQNFRRQVRQGELDFVFAHDGEHALEVLRDEPDIEMVLSDINMPRMDGLTLLERLNELHQDLKTVIVSAYGDMGNIRTAMNRGAFDFVTKPIEFDDLETTIQKTIDHLELLKGLQRQKAEAEKTRATLSRYFSPNIVKALEDQPEFLNSGAERRMATFLFTDLAEFTPLVESISSDLVVDLLNEYLDQLTRIIFDHDGTVMKIIGDALHAIFGAPMEHDEPAARAVACALAIDAFAEEFRETKNAQGIPLGVTRIGINSGPAIIGSFGGDNFFDYTAYGDAVNVAARLEDANKLLGTRICVSQTVVDQIPKFEGRPAGMLMLKGKSEALKAYEPLSAEHFASPATASYLEAYSKLDAGDASARQAFAALVGQYVNDPLANFHLGRVLTGIENTQIDMNIGLK